MSDTDAVKEEGERDEVRLVVRGTEYWDTYTPKRDEVVDLAAIADEKMAHVLTFMIYVLYAPFPLVWFAPILGVAANYITRRKAYQPLYASHYRWQMRTFWFMSMWMMLALPISLIYAHILGYTLLSPIEYQESLIGWLPVIFVLCWYYYRMIVGVYGLLFRKEMYTFPPEAPEKAKGDDAEDPYGTDDDRYGRKDSDEVENPVESARPDVLALPAEIARLEGPPEAENADGTESRKASGE